jgi:hypothetical protein
MAHSALPFHRLTGIDQRLAGAAARPVIVPEAIVVDYADPPVMPTSAQRPWSRVRQGRC